MSTPELLALRRVAKAAEELVKALRVCGPIIANAFVMEAMRGREYNGPSYAAELTALEAALKDAAE